jgi:hypothetical protein
VSDVGEDIRELLRERAEDVAFSPVLPGGALRRARRRRRAVALGAAATALAVAAAAVGGVRALQVGRTVVFADQSIQPKSTVVVRVDGSSSSGSSTT